MAHFAELDENNVVLRVIVVGNADTSDANGVEDESIGVAFCRKLFGGRWIKTSYNDNIRKRYAGIGFIYSQEHDAFLPPKPYPSWVLNPETLDWDSPVPKPVNYTPLFNWDEAGQSWVGPAPEVVP